MGNCDGAKPLINLEASAGIEPAYTDLQARGKALRFAGLGLISYQDKPKTSCEHDTPRAGAVFG